MEQPVLANIPGNSPETRELFAATNDHSIDIDQTQRICLQPQVADLNHHKINDNNNSIINNKIRKINSHASSIDSAEAGHIKNSSCVIPGVEHVFFEKELERMEHLDQDSHIVILAVDNSVPSEIAFKFFVDHVNRPGYVLHVVHHSNYWGHLEPSEGGPSLKHCQELIVKEDTSVREVEEKYKKMMAENHITGQFAVLRGKDAWHCIIEYQEKVNGIMIVMGTRGQNSLRRTFMGSVSDSVVHHASCPVLVCCHPKN